MNNSWLLACSLALPSLSVLSAEKPNIVIIMSDDSGYTDVGCYGSEIDTPHIDTLAAQGMRLSSFYNNGRCSPTRASLLTGLESPKVGFGGGVVGDWYREFKAPAHRGRLPYKTPLLPELLKEQGYRTLMAGKWHLGGSVMKNSAALQGQWKKSHPGWDLTEQEMSDDFLALPSQRGFDEYFGLYSAEGNQFITPSDMNPIMDGNERAALNFDTTYTMRCYTPKGTGRYAGNDGKSGKAFYDTDGITERAVQMIQNASGTKKPPFLLYLSYRAPHLPLQAPEELVQKYLPRYENLAAVEAARVAGLKAEGLYPADAGYRKTWLAPEKMDDYKLMLATHAAMMEKIDDGVGRVMAALQASGEFENTLVLYFSDNGCASHVMGFMNAPYHGSKALLWEGGTKSHFIAAWPGKIEPGSQSDNQVWVGDIMPTCLELAGATYPETFRGARTTPLDGRSMLPTLAGKKVEPIKVLFANDKGQQSLIVDGRWKLLIEPGWFLQTQSVPGIATELYDLQADPSETHNLAGSMPEMVRKLSDRCAVWQKKMGLVDYGTLLKIRPKDVY